MILNYHLKRNIGIGLQKLKENKREIYETPEYIITTNYQNNSRSNSKNHSKNNSKNHKNSYNKTTKIKEQININQSRNLTKSFSTHNMHRNINLNNFSYLDYSNPNTPKRKINTSNKPSNKKLFENKLMSKIKKEHNIKFKNPLFKFSNNYLQQSCPGTNPNINIKDNYKNEEENEEDSDNLEYSKDEEEKQIETEFCNDYMNTYNFLKRMENSNKNNRNKSIGNYSCPSLLNYSNSNNISKINENEGSEYKSLYSHINKKMTKDDIKDLIMSPINIEN